nr:DnaT-like ssDNA-binding domain-containing protein [Pseudomonas sp. VE 267-6A]
MTDDWEPESRSFTAVLARNGMANQRFNADQLLEFRSYWISRPGDHKTQSQWEHALAQQLKRQSRIQQAEGTRHETGGRTPGRSTRNAHDILTDPNW